MVELVLVYQSDVMSSRRNGEVRVTLEIQDGFIQVERGRTQKSEN
jgi:hypothetical protein